MNKTRALLKLLVLSLVVAALPVLATAPEPPPAIDELAPPGAPGFGPRLGAWWANRDVIDRLALAPAQRQRIENLVHESGQKSIDLRAEHHKAQLELTRLLAAEALDDAAIDRTLDKLVGAKCALDREHSLLRVEIARVLSREQRVALRELVRERAGEGRPGLQRRRGR